MKKTPPFLEKYPGSQDKWLYIRNYKTEKGCSECGYNKSPMALELDHVDRSKKTGKLSKAYFWPWDRIHEELKNCVVLCANCHREKTEKEKDYMEIDWIEEDDPQLDLL